MNSDPKLLQQHGLVACSDFEFPTPVSVASPNDLVFCGKLITRRIEPGPVSQTEKNKESRIRPRSQSVGESRCRRSGSFRKHYNGMFGTVKFPLQMELSDIKTRQEQREPATQAKDGGGDSYWELVAPLRRRGTLMSALLAKAKFGCIPNF